MTFKEYLLENNSLVSNTAIGIKSYTKFLRRQAQLIEGFLTDDIRSSGSKITIDLPYMKNISDGVYNEVMGINQAVVLDFSQINLDELDLDTVIPCYTRDGQAYVNEIRYNEVISKLGENVQMMKASAVILDTCTSKLSQTALAADSVISNVRAAMPNASDEVMTFVSTITSSVRSPIEMCFNIISNDVTSLTHPAYSEDSTVDNILISSGAYTGNAAVSALTAIGADITACFNAAWQGFLKIGEWLTTILGNLFNLLIKMIVGADIFTDYQVVGDSLSGILDIPFFQIRLPIEAVNNSIFYNYEGGAVSANTFLPWPKDISDRSSADARNFILPNVKCSLFNVGQYDVKYPFLERFLNSEGTAFHNYIEIPTRFGVTRFTLFPVFKSETNSELTLIENLDMNFTQFAIQMFVYSPDKSSEYTSSANDAALITDIKDMARKHIDDLAGTCCIPIAWNDKVLRSSYIPVLSNEINLINSGVDSTNPFEVFKYIRSTNFSGNLNDINSDWLAVFDGIAQGNDVELALVKNIAIFCSYFLTYVYDSNYNVGNFSSYYASNPFSSSLVQMKDFEDYGSDPASPLLPVTGVEGQFYDIWTPFISDEISAVNLHYQTTSEKAAEIKTAIYRGAAIIGAAFIATAFTRMMKNRKIKLAKLSADKTRLATIYSNNPTSENKAALYKVIKKENRMLKAQSSCGSLIDPVSSSNAANLSQQIVNLIR